MEGGVVHDPGDGTLEWGAWFELTDPSERITSSMLHFFGDMMHNLPNLLPKAHQHPLGWYPTMVLSVEYKGEIPDDPAISRRIVGVYSRSSFMNTDLHDIYVELWTSPSISGLGGGIETEGWRDKQVCLGISSQTALIVPRCIAPLELFMTHYFLLCICF
ncbi:hypothetical protein M422DRAFT_263049 [Sphaerobolus stellatus SS14]|uniref:Uncharacterized protein n=1 Tax=Sphaerobolus stellatus (strain SS14) TaxID=990650 RepID=A0A0C9VC31_SPHS4|nr:hypothetical protein M422DRAFT_263049 [Sphaerobolus stellatus SS14]